MNENIEQILNLETNIFEEKVGYNGRVIVPLTDRRNVISFKLYDSRYMITREIVPVLEIGENNEPSKIFAFPISIANEINYERPIMRSINKNKFLVIDLNIILTELYNDVTLREHTVRDVTEVNYINSKVNDFLISIDTFPYKNQIAVKLNKALGDFND